MNLTVHNLGLILAVLLLCIGSRFLSLVAARQWVLLLVSYLFYASLGGWPFLFVLLASSLVNYALASALRRHPNTTFLWIGIGFNVLLLGFFKYLPATAGLWDRWFDSSSIVMPIGISFWTFQALSYLIDVYREEDIDPSLIEFCLYMAFWPTVLAGPICRLPAMLPQFRGTATPARNDIGIGTTRIVQGLLLKFVLAQAVGAGITADGGVGAGFDARSAWSGSDVWVLAVGYGFQLFFDFAGYSYMAMGCARLLGIRVNENFDQPYLAATPSGFWTRWHKSLSFWIRDYVFLPLSGLGRNRWWPYCALVVSMVVFGLWHAPKMTFLVWGFYHGMLLVAHRIGQQTTRRFSFKTPESIGHLLSWTTTFLLISLGWILFRASDIAQARTMLRTLVSLRSYAHPMLPLSLYVAVASLVGGYFLYARLAARLADWKTQSTDLPLTSYRAQAVQLADLLSARRFWWLTPMAMAILLLATIIAVKHEQSSTVAPFIYGFF